MEASKEDVPEKINNANYKKDGDYGLKNRIGITGRVSDMACTVVDNRVANLGVDHFGRK